jgi:predicted transcriptional regulator
MDETVITLTADIVSAHVSNNSVAVGDLTALISSVHAALTALGQEAAAPAEAKREPAVTVRSSVKPEAIVCLVCGTKNKMLKRHLHTAHGLTPAEYRAEFGLKANYPMVAPNYSEQRRTLAHSIGLGRKREGSSDGKKPSKPSGGGPARPRKAAEEPAA